MVRRYLDVEKDSTMRFVIFKDTVGKYRWHLQDANNRILADSGQGYKDKLSCRHAIHLIILKASEASITDRTV